MYRLVIADDEQNICDGIRIAIESSCPEITITGIFQDGAELLNHIRQNPADIIICDICMDNMTGLDIASYVNENHLDTRIILITGYRRFEYAQQAVNSHVDYFLTKPFSSLELIDIMKKIESDIAMSRQDSVVISAEEHPKTKAIVKKAVSFIEENYVNASLSRDMIADHLAINASHLSRAFRNIMGENLTTYIVGIRMEHAKRLLKETSRSIDDIATTVGFNDSTYFKRSFKKHVGITPSTYRFTER